MRTLVAVLIGIVLLPAGTAPDRTSPPTVAAETVTIREVRAGSLVERPAGAREGAKSSVFVVDRDGVMMRRVVVEYRDASPPLIQIVSGVSPGDRIIVSDMRAWDAFERLQLRVR
jgi:HlyD family secretion protein